MLSKTIGAAIENWWIGVLLGFLPIMGHATAEFLSGKHTPYSPEQLFMAITTTGNVIFTMVKRLRDGEVDAAYLGFGVTSALSVSLLVLLAAGVAYGVLVAKGESDGSSVFAIMALWLAIVVSFSAELTLARAAVYTKHRRDARVIP